MIEVRTVAEALPAMQALGSETWTPQARHHPGQLAWSAAYALPEELDHGPVALAPTATAPGMYRRLGFVPGPRTLTLTVSR